MNLHASTTLDITRAGGLFGSNKWSIMDNRKASWEVGRSKVGS